MPKSSDISKTQLPPNTGRDHSITVRLTNSKQEVEAAQRLRYEVFYEEFAAKPNQRNAMARLDFDEFDDYADHLIVIDEKLDHKIVGTYRLLNQTAAKKIGHFYSSDEFDLTKLLDTGKNLLELGRSCVLPEYRTKLVLNLLWEGIADYVSTQNIELIFGCASLSGTDIPSISHPLSYLHYYHLAPEEIRPRALKGYYINMDIVPKDELEAKRAFTSLPPLIKGYLRVGAAVGDGAFIDHQFNTTDVCIVMDTQNVTTRYRSHYERRIQKDIPGKDHSDG